MIYGCTPHTQLTETWAGRCNGHTLLFSCLFINSLFKPGITRASDCVLSSVLENPCHPLLGAFSSNYPGVNGLVASIANHESLIGRKLDLVRSYYPPGKLPLNNEDKTLISRGYILFANYRPATPWSAANGSDPAVTARIDQTADSIKSVAPKKIMLSLEAEPEDDVSGSVSCTTLKAKTQSGTPEDYVAMWHFVRSRFDAKGVQNVVWVMNYMGYNHWDCMIKSLWPGDTYVDWVMWDPYILGNYSYSDAVKPFYNTLTAQSSPGYNFVAKPWGLAEWGVGQAASQAQAYQTYAQAQAALSDPSYAKLKAYSIFDTINPTDFRIAYDTAGRFDSQELAAYKAFANDARFGDGNNLDNGASSSAVHVARATPKTAPTANNGSAPIIVIDSTLPTLPDNSVAIEGSAIMIGSVHSSRIVNSKHVTGSVILQAPTNLVWQPTRVDYLVNGKTFAVVKADPFTTKLDTTHLPNGVNTLETRVYSSDGSVRVDRAHIYVDNRHGAGRLIPIERNDRLVVATAIGTPMAGSSVTGGLWLSGRRRFINLVLARFGRFKMFN